MNASAGGFGFEIEPPPEGWPVPPEVGAEVASHHWAPVAEEQYTGEFEYIHAFYDQMPTGVAVTESGRMFVSYPRWGDEVDFTVAELRDGEEVPYPNAEINTLHPDDPSRCLASVHRMTLDGAGGLWLMDNGSVDLAGPPPGAAKLVCVDLGTDEVVRTIGFSRDVVFRSTYLNDVRIDLRRGEEGMAFISDSGHDGPCGFVVVDLASGDAWRQLTGHDTVRPVDAFVPFIEGRPTALPLRPGVDGVAMSPDGARLYYAPIYSRRLYSVSLAALADESCRYEDVARTISDLGEKGASDGLDTDTLDRVYATNYEHGCIIRAGPDEPWTTLLHQPGMMFVDSLSLAGDGYIYATINQLHRHPYFHDGVDHRKPPYRLLRVPTDAKPVRPAP